MTWYINFYRLKPFLPETECINFHTGNDGVQNEKLDMVIFCNSIAFWIKFQIDVNSERKLSFQCNFCFAVKLFSDYRLRSFRMFYCEVTATNSVPFSDFTFYCLPSNI